MTSSNGNIFRVTSPLCGEFTGPGEFPAQRPVTRSFDVFFDLPLNKRLSKQPWGWWYETPAWSLWRHRNVWGPNLGHPAMCLQMSWPLNSLRLFGEYICTSKLTIIGLLLIEPLGKNFSEVLIETHIFIKENAFENVVWKMSAILSLPQCVKMLGHLQAQYWLQNWICFFKVSFSVNNLIWPFLDQWSYLKACNIHQGLSTLNW